MCLYPLGVSNVARTRILSLRNDSPKRATFQAKKVFLGKTQFIRIARKNFYRVWTFPALGSHLLQASEEPSDVVLDVVGHSHR